MNGARDSDKIQLLDRKLYDALGTEVSGTFDTATFVGGALNFFRPDTSGTYYYEVRGGRSTTAADETGKYRVHLAREDHGRSEDSATTISRVGGRVTGSLWEDGTFSVRAIDRDRFKIALEAGKTYRVQIWGTGDGQEVGGTLADPEMIITHRTTTGALRFITDVRDSGEGKNEEHKFVAPDTTDYFIIVSDYASTYLGGSYTVFVSEVISLTVGTPRELSFGWHEDEDEFAFMPQPGSPIGCRFT